MLKKFLFLLFITSIIFSQQQFSFYQTNNYNNEIQKPKEFLGFAIGERPTRYFEMVPYLKYLAENSPRVKVDWRGQTHEGRKLYYVIISSEKNINNLDQIKQNIQALSDPRKTNNAEAEKLIDSTPGVAMMMYSIHGNELSGADASIQLAYQLAAGNDERTLNLLENLITIIYPMENPDGRERFLSDVETWKGKVPTDDVQSLPHRGTWPTGRTNHYHFDLNRDWIILSQPETRSRVSLIMEWYPQFVVDAHEMGSYSSFLMNPPREPINPFLNKKIKKWWKVFASDQAKALDEFGWSYYTREWLEDWYPGYGSSYGSYFGAVSILYEQARTAGLNVKRPAGDTLTFKESVEHQFVSSLANLSTAAQNKSDLMKTFYEIRKSGLTPSHPLGIEAFVVNVDDNKTRADSLIKILQLQGIEVFEAAEDFEISKAKNYFDERAGNKEFKKGSYIIPLAQPHQDLLKAIFDFDTRLKTSFLKIERESLLKDEGSEIYEVTAWSLPLSFAVDAYECYSVPNIEKQPVDFTMFPGKVENKPPQYGYLIEYKDDKVVKFLNELLESDAKVRAAEKEFKVAEREYDKGTLLLRIEENPENIESVLDNLSQKYSVNVIGVNTALAQKGTDLGGDYFGLLTKPKVGFLVGQNSSMYSFGELWYLLDNRIELKTSILYLDYLGYHDLRKYNVLVLPSTWGNLKDAFNKSAASKLKTWIEEGGTLITIGSSAAVLADSSVGISNIKVRRNDLKKLNDYYELIAENEAKNNVSIDSNKIWESGEVNLSSVEPVMKIDEKEEAENDKNYLKFMPQGVILSAKFDKEHWLTNGVEEKLPVFYSSSYSYFALEPVEIVGRLRGQENVRLSGLLWPEAKHRLSYASYLMRERVGQGQIITFAESPFFRAQYLGSGKLFLNAIFLGPGLGTSQAVDF